MLQMETKLNLAMVAFDTTKLTRLDGINDSMDMSLGRLRKMVKDREAWRAAVGVVTKSWASSLVVQWLRIFLPMQVKPWV